MQHSAYKQLTKSLWDSFDYSPSPRDIQRAERTHYRMMFRAGKEAQIFTENAIDAFNFKRSGDWRCVEGVGYSSFDAYIAAPHIIAEKVGRNADGSPIWEERTITYTDSTVHLGVQVVFGLMYLFWIPKREIMQIGQKKLIKLIPYLERTVLCHGVVPEEIRVQVGTEVDPDSGYPVPIYSIETVYTPLRLLDTDAWEVLREIVCLWIERAKVLSYTELKALLGDSRGWVTAFSQPLQVGFLRKFRTVEEVIDYFGMSDLPDDHVVVGNFKYQTGGLVANGSDTSTSQESSVPEGS